MGIFNNKQDETQTGVTNGSTASVNEPSSTITPSSTTVEPVNETSEPSTAPIVSNSTTTTPVDNTQTSPAVDSTEVVTTDTPESNLNSTAPAIVEEVKSESTPDVGVDPATELNVAPTLDTPSVTESSVLTPPLNSANNTTTDLENIKEEAIKQLSPILGQLDQTPEEKFHTTMMLLQSTDDKSLIKSAYEAAQSITDEKIKAQALLDIVNEINYFTQNNEEASA